MCLHGDGEVSTVHSRCDKLGQGFLMRFDAQGVVSAKRPFSFKATRKHPDTKPAAAPHPPGSEREHPLGRGVCGR